MNRNPNSRQCEIARAMTKSCITNVQIREELHKLSDSEWDVQCTLLDGLLKEHNASFDKAFPVAVDDFRTIGASNGVNEATLFVAYMEWKNN